MNKLIVFSFIVISLFSLFGLIMFGSLVHELSHKNDFKNIASNGSICLLEYGTSTLASYTFDSNNELEFKRINKYTEYKAYSFNIILSVLFFYCLFTLGQYIIDIYK